MQGLHRRRGRAEADLPLRLLRGRRRQPLAALPRCGPAARSSAQHVPLPRNSQGPQHGHRGPRGAAVLRGPGGEDQDAVRGGGPERVCGRRARAAPRVLRRLPAGQRRRGDRGGPAPDVRSAGGNQAAAEGHAWLLAAHAHAGAGHGHHRCQRVPDLCQQGAHRDDLSQEHVGPPDQEECLVLLHLRVDGPGRLRPHHGLQRPHGRPGPLREVAATWQLGRGGGVGRHRRDRPEANDLRVQGRLRPVRPGTEAHRPRGHAGPHEGGLLRAAGPLRGRGHGLPGPDLADDVGGCHGRQRPGPQELR
mmetsp:Transcript_67163/g.190489  ORF Transcript_67163/g.190489 Transcript_67163/m.190489 type:complete len:305 (-) Transcript_67163:60-974(-)